MLAAKELSREQFQVFMNEDCCGAELNEKTMQQAISRSSITGVMENLEGAFRDKKYPYDEIRGVLGQVYALDNPHEILGIEDRIVHFICNMNDEALKAKMVEENLTRAVEYDCPALRATLINNCGLNVEAIEECKATTLGTAARTGNIKVVRELLGLHTDVNRMYGEWLNSPICDAVWSGCGADPIEDVRLPTQLDIVKLFIQAGANLNIIFKGNYSIPLMNEKALNL